MVCTLILVPVIAAILLLIFFFKKIAWWELAALILPAILIIVLMNTIMVSYSTSDTEYIGNYIKKVTYYEPWDEEVSCRHSYDCNCTTDKDGRKSCSTCYMHSYDVDYHSEYWVKEDNSGNEYSISEYEYNELVKRFGTKTYFIELNRDYHSIDGDAYSTDWNGEIDKSDVISSENSYTNKVKASHSIFKFDIIGEKEKKLWSLYDYPEIKYRTQQVVLGYPIDVITNRRLQYINGYYGPTKQFRMYMLFFKNQSPEVAYKQRSYWEGGNKNEFVICINLDNRGDVDWIKCFSWMDKPELEVEVQEYFMDNKKIDLSKFASWMPKQIEEHWHRKHFKDFDYLEIELTNTQLWWVIIIVILYNIGISIWIVVNEFNNR